MRRFRTVGILLTLCLTPVLLPAQSAPAMRDILGALLDLTPLAVSPERFADPANAERIDSALQRLASNALGIDAHATGFAPVYDRVRRTFADDARRALDAFEQGDLYLSRFVTRNLTRDCFACHSRLPAAAATDALQLAFAQIDLQQVPAGDRLRLLVSSRRFDSAMRLAEEMLDDRSIPALQLDRWGVVEDYLKVALRVDRNPTRPRVALERFNSRDDLPTYLQLHSRAWVESLDRLGPTQAAEPGSESGTDLLERAEGLLASARAANLYLQDRRGLVDATMASGLLHEYVLRPEAPSGRRAEAYYLLGLAEATISRGIWVPETEYFLELAIRTAPGSPAARSAFAFLEQFVIANYTGSAGTDIPPDVIARLRRLRQLAEG